MKISLLSAIALFLNLGLLSHAEEKKISQSAKVYANTADGDAEIYTSRQDGAGEKKLTDNDVIDNVPVLSPDGKTILFLSNRRQRIHLMQDPVHGRPDGWGTRDFWRHRGVYCPH